jgi:pilus assembly protein Flp/PilA
MIHSFVNAFLKEEDGQDLVEYSLLLAFIALAAVSILATVKTSIAAIWTKINTDLTTAKTGMN